MASTSQETVDGAVVMLAEDGNPGPSTTATPSSAPAVSTVIYKVCARWNAFGNRTASVASMASDALAPPGVDRRDSRVAPS